MKELFYHEDFYCQVEILPMAALESSRNEMGEIAGFSDAHWDGTSWTAIYVREGKSVKLNSLGIPIDNVAAGLDSILEPVAEIYTGYSTYRERCTNTRAWVLPCGTALLADFDGTGVIEQIWIVKEPPNPENIDLFRQALRVLGEYGELFIADWNKGIAVPCRDDDQLLRYLSGTSDS